MKTIKLKSQDLVIIDDEDYEKVSQFKWFADKRLRTIYAKRNTPFRIYLHRFLLNPTKTQEIDHINGNGLDNRKSNLRVSTHSQNKRNSKKYISNKAGYKGVYKPKKKNHYRAQISIDGKTRQIGCFKTPEEAASAYNKYVLKIEPKFAKINFGG